jgi:hypothetical protein
MLTEFKRVDAQLTPEVRCGYSHLTEVEMECEVCGREACECPRPLGECCSCRVPIFEADAWMVDSEGGHFCARCWPGGDDA